MKDLDDPGKNTKGVLKKECYKMEQNKTKTFTCYFFVLENYEYIPSLNLKLL